MILLHCFNFQGHPVNVKDNGGWTSLHEACNWGHANIARLLIEHGANIDVKGMGNVTPLLDAASNGQFDIINLLLDAGATIAAVDEDVGSVGVCCRLFSKVDAFLFQGNTVLDLLESYKRNSGDLCLADEAEYQRLKKLLEERMKNGESRRTLFGELGRLTSRFCRSSVSFTFLTKVLHHFRWDSPPSNGEIAT